MVFIDLIVQFESENIEEIFIQDTSFKWFFKVKCGGCGNDFENEVYFSEEDEVEIKGSRGNAHFAINCKQCKRQSSITVYKESGKHVKVAGGKGKGVLATFDCRGLELISWDPQDQLSCTAEESLTQFDDLDFSDLPWCDYDEATSNTLTIESIKHEFQRNNKLK